MIGGIGWRCEGYPVEEHDAASSRNAVFHRCPWVRRDVEPTEVQAGMVIDEDLHAATGMLLLRCGERGTPALLERLRTCAARLGLEGPTVAVREPRSSTAA